MNLFEKMIIELNEEKEIKLRADAEEMKTLLKRHLKLDEIHFLPKSGLTIKLLVPDVERWDYQRKLEEMPELEYDPEGGDSSLGAFYYKKATLLIKPIERQGRKSAGVENEDNFENFINEHASKERPIEVKFVFNKGLEIVKNVIAAEGVGTRTSTYKKTDIILKTKSGRDYNISIKKTNAEIWESADTRFKHLVREFMTRVEKGKYPEIYFGEYVNKAGRLKPNIFVMKSNKTNETVSGVVLKIEDKEEAKNVIFAGDEVDVVVVATFREEDISFDEEKRELEVKVKELYSDMNDVKSENAWPWLKIRHDSTRKSFKGLRPVIYKESAIFKKNSEDLKGNVLKLSL